MIYMEDISLFPLKKPSKQLQAPQDTVICGFESLKITVLDKSHHSSSATTKNIPGIQYV